MLVGLSIGIVVLTGLMSFYFKSTRMIADQQGLVKNLNQLQFIMNKIVEDVKSANTQIPESGTTVTSSDWDSLPYFGYGYPVVDNSGNPVVDISIYQPMLPYPKEKPIYPVAYNFPSQINSPTTKTGTSKGWYPIPNPDGEDDTKRESNELVFYKVINNEIVRVRYYLEVSPDYNIDPKVYRLRKRTQFQPISQGLIYKDTNSRTLDTIILSDVKLIHFTYPRITEKLIFTTSPLFISSDTSQYDKYDKSLYDDLLSINTTELDVAKRPYLQSMLLNPYRNTIKIRLAIAGPQIGNKRVTAFELITEVTTRN